jgi:uncharacterized protein (DUF58 family)
VTDKVERFVPPKKGRRHVLRVIGEILAFEPMSRGTNLAAALDLLGKIARRRSVVFLVSDFLSEGWEQAARVARTRHELVPVVVGDPLETELPKVGLIMLEDLETGQLVEFDTGGYAGRDFTRRAAEAARLRDAALRRLNVDLVEVQTNESYVDALIAFFKARAKRMAHG